MVQSLPPSIEEAEMSEQMKSLVQKAKTMYKEKLANTYATKHKPPAWVVSAPGRVNLMGDHTDYTGGFVLPLAVDYNTVVYGTGHLHSGKGDAPTMIQIHCCSDAVGSDVIEERVFSVMEEDLQPPLEEAPRSWMDYVMGTVVQFVPDMPSRGATLDIAMAYSSNVPLGAGLSASASLEVATAMFVECIIHDLAYSDIDVSQRGGKDSDPDIQMERAIRCQRAENEWAYSPCGIIDQMAAIYCEAGKCMLLDCSSLKVTQIPFKEGTEEDPVLVIANTGVEHKTQADSEYGNRRRECKEAVDGIQAVPLYHVTQLRDANVKDVEEAYEKDKIDDILYKRAMHVVTENSRTKECKTCIKLGLWDKVGDLMNKSQESLKDNFEVSCEELDTLIEIARAQEGVYGSRLTGGGFGGCTVTLVKRENADALIEALKGGYQAKFNRECQCFTTLPAQGGRRLAHDMAI